MNSLVKKYSGKELSTDEYAEARNAISQEMEELEKIRLKTKSDDYILLKWGTLKGWNFTSEKGKELFKEYASLGMTMGAMSQDDTDEQKKLICQMIDECSGSIQNDWDGDFYTKQQAKEYVMEYRS